MKNLDTVKKSRLIAEPLTLDGHNPEVMDVWYKGVELCNRQLGKGRFFGKAFRAVLDDSLFLIAGYYNNIPTFGEGSIDTRLHFAVQMNRNGSLRLNGESLDKPSIAVHGVNKELVYHFGESHTSWLTIQIKPEDFEKASFAIAPGHFSIVRTDPAEFAQLISELQLMLEALHNNNAEGRGNLDVDMAKGRLISLFSLLINKDSKNEKLNNAEYLRMVCLLRDYMEANLENPVTMMDLCSLSGKSESTIRRAFQRIYGISPRRALTVHRLNATYLKLRQTPPSKTTVSNIALRYGFLHFGRFSAAYKEHFGEYPSETLARDL